MSLRKKISSIFMIALVSLFMSANVQADGEKFVLISHAPDSDSWWNTIKNAIRQAGEDVNVSVQYQNPPTGDLADMARIIDQAVARNPDGIIVTIADYDVLRGPISKAVKKGIPVVTINSGTHKQSEALGAMFHVGQPEYDAGFGAGKKAKAAGAKSFLCVNHYIENPASVERCQGIADAMGVSLKGNMIDSGIDPVEIQKKVEAFMRSKPNTDAVITLGPTSAHPTIRALKGNDDVYFATFDLSGEIATAIKAGTIEFGIDQQPYLQGYLPVVALALNVRYGLAPANHINSGPGFVTKSNIGLVEKFAGEIR